MTSSKGKPRNGRKPVPTPLKYIAGINALKTYITDIITSVKSTDESLYERVSFQRLMVTGNKSQIK